MSKDKISKPIIRVAHLGLDASKVNHKELCELQKANPDCDVRVCFINTNFHTKVSPIQNSTDQLLNSEFYEALKGFRIEEIYDRSLFEEVIRHQEQK